MSRFYFGGSDSEESDDGHALPYPKPLARSAFLTPDFSPTEYLSSLRNRHQTLEDLRGELRARSQELNKELLDLVNDNYQDFLNLGGTLRGGDERVEEIRLGLLSFQREIDGLKAKVLDRRKEVEALVEERRGVAKEVRAGRTLLEVDARLEELERALRIGQTGNGHADEDETEDIDISESEDDMDDEETGGTISVPRLRRRVQQLVYVKRLMAKAGPAHPFVMKQEERVSKVRRTLLLDLDAGLEESRKVRAGSTSSSWTLKILMLYQDLEEIPQALSAVKAQRSQIRR